MAINTRNKVSAAFSMSSMTDIVFLLLIFFMITSTLVQPPAEMLDLPNSDHQTDAKPQIQVFVTKIGEYTVQRNEDVRQFERGNMEAVLSELMAKDNESYISLNAEKGVSIKRVVDVMNIAKKNGYKLILKTNPKPR